MKPFGNKNTREAVIGVADCAHGENRTIRCEVSQIGSKKEKNVYGAN
jgi:hypothetical protein